MKLATALSLPSRANTPSCLFALNCSPFTSIPNMPKPSFLHKMCSRKQMEGKEVRPSLFIWAGDKEANHKPRKTEINHQRSRYSIYAWTPKTKHHILKKYGGWEGPHHVFTEWKTKVPQDALHWTSHQQCLL